MCIKQKLLLQCNIRLCKLWSEQFAKLRRVVLSYSEQHSFCSWAEAKSALKNRMPFKGLLKTKTWNIRGIWIANFKQGCAHYAVFEHICLTIWFSFVNYDTLKVITLYMCSNSRETIRLNANIEFLFQTFYTVLGMKLWISSFKTWDQCFRPTISLNKFTYTNSCFWKATEA